MSSQSYAYGIDGESPLRHYFTYYTNLGHIVEHSICIETLVLIIILICSVVANATIIISILRSKEMRTVTNCFIGNLALADLIFALSIPFIIAARTSPAWNLGEGTCKLLSYSQFVCGSVLIWTLTAISVDRVQCLTSAPYRSGLTLRSALITVVISWMVCWIIYTPVAVFFQVIDVQYNQTITNGKNVTVELVNTTICTLSFPISDSLSPALIFTIVCAISASLIPMVIIIYNCHTIFRKLSEIQRKIEEKLGIPETKRFTKMRNSIQTIAGGFVPNLAPNADITSSNQLSRKLTIGSFHRLKRHRRAVRILIANLCAVLIMWLPITIVLFLIYNDGHRSDDKFFLTNQHFLWSVIIALTNTIVNPFLYGFLTENFKDRCSIHKWLRGFLCFVKDDVPSSVNQTSSSQNSRILSYLNAGMENT